MTPPTSTGTTSVDAAALVAGATTAQDYALFKAGARYAVRTMTVLADPELRKALAVLCELFGESGA